MIEIVELSKAFGTRKVLDRVSLEVRPSEIVFVLGRSGVGKSVLLKNIVGLMHPDGGRVVVDGEVLTGLSEEELTPFRKKCGMVFQFPALLDSLTVEENLLLGLEGHQIGRDRPERLEKIRGKLAWVTLDESILGRYPSSLSFGMQKRVSLLRTLLVEPEYLLFDEPTTGLDPVMTKAINALIRSVVAKTGAGALIVSHDILSALEISNRIVLIDGGRILFAGTGSEFKKSPLPLVRRFLEGAGFAG